MRARSLARVLCVGVATLDIIHRVASHPAEDSEVRALAQARRCGGNAANTAQVLAQLGDRPAWVGNLGDRPEAQLIRDTFDRLGVAYAMARVIPGGGVPTSCITLSEENGSRTIVHYRDLPEYAAADFLELDLRAFDWIHFEGRAVAQLRIMMERARALCGLPVSLEVEKPREGIEALFEQADLLFFSHHYLREHGHADPADFLSALPRGSMATCTWGERGAWARDFEGRIHHQPAAMPDRVVDTLGAGDTFNAGMLHAIGRGMAMQDALAFAVRLAGAQCARHGLEGVSIPENKHG